jgi:hypothetical protein
MFVRFMADRDPLPGTHAASLRGGVYHRGRADGIGKSALGLGRRCAGALPNREWGERRMDAGAAEMQSSRPVRGQDFRRERAWD